MSVTRSAFDAAVQRAKQTGQPAPVMDDKGHVAYYVDQQGATVDKPRAPAPGSAADRAAHPGRYSTDSSGSLRSTIAQQGEQAKRDQAAKAAAKANDKAAAAAAAQEQAAVDSANQGYVWLDGHRVKITAIGTDAAGNKQFTFGTDADGYKKQTPYTVPTAYAALDNASTTPASGIQFLMSNGIQLGADGNPILGQDDQSNGLMTQGHMGRNQMTIGNALQWLANLSVKDPTSYSAMVDKLHAAGYLTDEGYMRTAGHYSQDAADAFARAASDTATLNSTDPKGPGYNLTLDDLLSQKASAYAEAQRKARAASYQPTSRSYTDPTEIKGTAKSAAQAAIGRNLTPEEEAKLEAHIHSLEAAKYDQIDAAGRNGDNATVTDVSVPGQVDGFLDTQDAQEEANYSAAGYGAALRNLFGLHG